LTMEPRKLLYHITFAFVNYFLLCQLNFFYHIFANMNWYKLPE